MLRSVPRAPVGASAPSGLLAAVRRFRPFHPPRPGTEADVDRTEGTKRAEDKKVSRGKAKDVSDWRAQVAEVELPQHTKKALDDRKARQQAHAERVAAAREEAKIPDGVGLIRQAAANYEGVPSAKKTRTTFYDLEGMLKWFTPIGAVVPLFVMGYAMYRQAVNARAEEAPWADPPKIAKHEAEAEARAAATAEAAEPAMDEAAAFALREEYAAVESAVFSFIDTEYEDLGFVSRDEVDVTVRPGAFTQYGIITRDGVNALIDHVGLRRSDVFVDIGSGIGNVCVQVAAVSPCKHTVGLELLPSRYATGVRAGERAKEIFPETFGGATFDWIEGDAVETMPALAATKPSVIFTHSWMFDDELMRKLADGWLGIRSVRAIVTSRPLTPSDAGKLNGWTHTETTFGADWNDASPFHVYTRAAPAAASLDVRKTKMF